MNTSIAEDSVSPEELTEAVSERRGWKLYRSSA